MVGFIAAETVLAALTGGLLALLGALLSWLVNRSGDKRRLDAEDERRWMKDRRSLYARYLSLIEQLDREAGSIACFLPHDSEAPAMSEKDEALIREMSHEWLALWDDDVQPALSEMELMAKPKLADLAARAAHAILTAVPQTKIVGVGNGEDIVTPSDYGRYWQTAKRVRPVIEAMRNEMRSELELHAVMNKAPTDPDWPWIG